MANIKSQIKRNKTNKKSNMLNKSFKSSIKTAIKKVELALITKDNNIKLLINKAISLIDRSVNKKIFHMNKAIRLKNKLIKKNK